ncbi:MAG TPA: class I SAM-dependent methyltransferase [Bryobacteraceae bacterium]|nr:class I SAM-dependent methyltransferase [Bryobacteraceae bacterium]
MPGEPEADSKSRELSELIREIQERVRARYPEGAASGLVLPDLMEVAHARDAAQAKVAGIGTVNPRAPGPLNAAIQFVKRTVARALDWHVREQVEFNRAAVAAMEAVLEALNENNRALTELAGGIRESNRWLDLAKEEFAAADQRLAGAVEETRQHAADLGAHWAERRVAWEQRLAATENELLRTIAELKAAFEFRSAQVSEQIQRRLWADLDKVRGEYERTIHTELRLIRQRAALPEMPAAVPAAAAPAPVAPAQFDALRFADRFRGSEESIRARQQFYRPYFAGRGAVLDLGCGRGEFLEVMREAGVAARGTELSPEMAAICRAKGLEVETADLLAYLPTLPEGSLDGIFCAHVVEHLPPERLPEAIRAAARALAPGGILAIETPNPESLAIFATHFYLDPTHARPVPPALLNFYAEEAGLGRIEVHRLSPAVDDAPSLRSIPEDFRDAFFGALDYALIARKL